MSVFQKKIAKLTPLIALVIFAIAASTVAKSNLVDSVQKILPVALEAAIFFILFASLHVFLDTTVGLLISLFPEDNQDHQSRNG